jgi:hypothetical protein
VVRVTIVGECGAARAQEARERTLRIRYLPVAALAVAGEPESSLIEPEVAELLESPSSLLVASVSVDGVPDATRGWGVVLLGPDRLRVLLAGNATRTLANLDGGGAMALTVTHFLTLVSWQLKGRATGIAPPTAADQIRHDAFCSECVRILHESEGAPEEVIRRIVPPGIVACEMAVEQVFDQTPGPEAGARVAPVGA